MIVYRGGDKLYVPIDKIQMVQKYVGSEGLPLKLINLEHLSGKKRRQR